MNSASLIESIPQQEVEVWLEVGREGRCFTYGDFRELGVQIGDLVLVRLRGKPMQGIVVAKRFASEVNQEKSQVHQNQISLLPIEELVQSAAVDPLWGAWIDSLSKDCYTTSFRMLKAALPPGWLGQQKSKSFLPKKLWWVSLKEGSCSEDNLSRRQLDLVTNLVDLGGGCWQKDLLEKGFSSALVRSLLLKGLVVREKRVFEGDEHLVDPIDKSYVLEKPRRLTGEQQVAIEAFEALPSGGSLLLWGVTGSGKTEIYLQLAQKELRAGRHCLILVPEIGLIPQILDRFLKRLGPCVYEYHSGCSNRERVKTWKVALDASSPIVVVGTRSAIFIPLTPLGLIVLDEEHDSSYKQDSPMPCYHARELAMDRADKFGSRVVLGSATPSLSSWTSLTPKGSIQLVRLNSRISNQPLPRVDVVDMRLELAEGHRRLISRPLMESLRVLPEKGEQAVLLVPRRGYSSFLSCRSCGDVVQCPNCDVALTVHRSREKCYFLRCHWCDHRQNIQSSCQQCGSTSFKPFGAGTQRVFELLVKELEGLRFLRFDRDTTRGRDGHRKLLEKFASGEADVLIGTQMLAKGMDLPQVTLAAVLAADGLLHRPDLQAAEQSLQLFLQLAGRAGRGELPGKVLVQTYCPHHYVIKHLVDGRYEDFLRSEAKLRKESGLIPFCRACVLRVSGESSAITANAATALAEFIQPFCNESGWVLIGPAPALIPRMAGRIRWQILLHGPEGSSLPLPPGLTLWKLLPKGISLSVDPDPLNL